LANGSKRLITVYIESLLPSHEQRAQAGRDVDDSVVRARTWIPQVSTSGRTRLGNTLNSNELQATTCNMFQ